MNRIKNCIYAPNDTFHAISSFATYLLIQIKHWIQINSGIKNYAKSFFFPLMYFKRLHVFKEIYKLGCAIIYKICNKCKHD